MRKTTVIAAIFGASMLTGLSGCYMVGMDHINMNNSVAVFDRQQRVIDGITYTRVEYVDGAVEYTAHNSPPKGYTGNWSSNPNYQGTTILVGPKGTRRTIEAKGGAPDPTDPKLWEKPLTISSPEPQQPMNTPLLGPTASTLPPRGEGGGDGGGGGGGGGGGSGH